MSVIKKNIVANLIGSGWVAFISIIFIPLYIHFMGVESYGLIGFYLTLQAIFAVLDMGLTGTVSRELARLSALESKAQEMRNLMRTLETVYWAIAVIIITIVVLLAPWMASEWINASTISEESIRLSIVLMGIMIALRMPYGFYSGGLLGLQRQVLLNIIKVSVETLKSGGAVIVLWLVSPSIIWFFSWQLIISGFGLCLIAIMVWRAMPYGKAAKFKSGIFSSLWRFAAGMSGISILATILTQSDKLILSKMLSLETFAHYVLASTVSMGLYVIITPIFSAVYPRLTQLAVMEEENSLIDLYHKSCQLMTVLVVPFALVISFFSEDILRIWTQNPTVSSQTAPILSLMIVGTAINGMMNIPYALQLAHGWTTLAIYMNIIAIAILVPMLILSVSIYGALGGAMVWLVLNAGYLFFGLRIMHQRLLKNELGRWLLSDLGIPAFASLLIIALFWWAKWDGIDDYLLGFWILLSYSFACISSVYLASAIRPLVWPYTCKIFRLVF